MAQDQTLILWRSTSPNPRVISNSADAGQRGWRLHAIEARDGEKHVDYNKRIALCGLRPSHGWGVDLFIDRNCAKCAAVIARREAAGEVFEDLGAIMQERYRNMQAAKERLLDEQFERESSDILDL